LPTVKKKKASWWLVQVNAQVTIGWKMHHVPKKKSKKEDTRRK